MIIIGIVMMNQWMEYDGMGIPQDDLEFCTRLHRIVPETIAERQVLGAVARPSQLAVDSADSDGSAD